VSLPALYKSAMRTVIQTPEAPAAIGPYSQAIDVGSLVFLSGQIPLDPKTGEMVGIDARTQTTTSRPFCALRV
jgi:enamine deaminase RidA (YjgF/YER057c/UK114 family)